VWNDRQPGSQSVESQLLRYLVGAVEEFPLLEAVTRQLPVKTLRVGKGLAGADLLSLRILKPQSRSAAYLVQTQ
jgi:hypothetical protein